MSSRPNNSSKPVLDYSKLLKKNTQSQEPVQESVPVQETVPVQESVPVQEPVKESVQEKEKKAKKLSDAQYAKKLEKKASKKAELEKADKEKEEKLSEIDSKAQKVYDDEYQILFIECKTSEEAHQKAMSKRNKVYAKLLNDAFPKTQTQVLKQEKIQTPVLKQDETQTPVLKQDETIIQSQSPVLKQETITEEEIKEFQSLSKKQSKNIIKQEITNSPSPYNIMLNKACELFIIDILSESVLNKLETILRTPETTDRVYVSVNTDFDVISSFKGHNFTKSGFLKNTNYYFSKQLSKFINNKLQDLRVWVNIKNIKDNEYSIAFSQKH